MEGTRLEVCNLNIYRCIHSSALVFMVSIGGLLLGLNDSIIILPAPCDKSSLVILMNLVYLRSLHCFILFFPCSSEIHSLSILMLVFVPFVFPAMAVFPVLLFLAPVLLPFFPANGEVWSRLKIFSE